MSEENKIAAAILACEASRQQQEMVRAGPGKTPTARDVAGELWSYFESFLERLERDRARSG
jgi:hypothetical protein